MSALGMSALGMSALGMSALGMSALGTGGVGTGGVDTGNVGTGNVGTEARLNWLIHDAMIRHDFGLGGGPQPTDPKCLIGVCPRASFARWSVRMEISISYHSYRIGGMKPQLSLNFDLTSWRWC